MLGSGSYKSSLTYFRLVALGQHLARLGWDVSMIVPSADKYNNFTPEPDATLPEVTLVQPWQPATSRLLINLVPYLLTAMTALLRLRPQLVYVYKPTPITIIGLVPKVLFHVPVVLDLDDLGSEVMRLEGQPRLLVALVALCEHLALRYADAVVVASTYLEQLVRQQQPHKPVLLLSNGVEPEQYVPSSAVTPRPHMYYFGALNRLSLIEPFLRALPRTLEAVPDASVTILGGGNAIEAARRLAEELGISERIIFTGWIDKDAVHQYVQFADLALCVQPDMPTVRAASNLKVFQYMALASVPVVSDVGDLPAYVQGMSRPVGVAVPHGDQDALVDALVGLLRCGETRAEMARAARRLAETTYAWSTLASRLNTFLRDVPRKRNRQTLKIGERHA